MRNFSASEKILAGVLLVFVVLGSFLLLKGANKRTPTVRALPSYCANGAVPSACIFGLKHSPYVIESQYQWEANLLDGDPPRGDHDYMLPYGQELVKLPGGPWNHYSYQGAIYVPGSGWVAKFITPTGGHFAFLHLRYVNGPGVVAALPNTGAPPVYPAGLSGDEETALIAGKLAGAARRTVSSLPGATSWKGGDVVGLSGWPDWPIYGNGSYGPVDGHLCVLVSARSLGFFWKVALGRDVPPRKPFPTKKWGPTRSRDKHGHLVWSAAWTYHHGETSIYPHLKKDRWFGHTATRKYGYAVYRFHGSKLGKVLRCWPHYKRCQLSGR